MSVHRFARFESLSVDDQRALEKAIDLSSLRPGKPLTIRRYEFMEWGERFEGHKLAISYGCTIALNLGADHIGVICDYAVKAPWIRSHIHDRKLGGGVISHLEFKALAKRHALASGILEPSLESLLTGNTHSSSTPLLIVHGNGAQTRTTLELLEPCLGHIYCIVLSD